MTSTDDIFLSCGTLDDSAIGGQPLLERSLTLDLDELVDPAPQLDMWGTLTLTGEMLMPMAEPPSDECVAFLSHINGEALELPSCASSPKSITSHLLTPVTSSKRSKPKAFRASATTKAKSEAVDATKVKTEAQCVATTEAPTGESREQAVSSVPSDSEATMDMDDTEAAEAAEATLSSASDEEKCKSEASESTPTLSAATDDEKRKQRMVRNRASAAESRKRKRKQLEDYESLVASLHDTVNKLQQQNDELRRACALASTKNPSDEPTLPRPEAPALQLGAAGA